MSRKYVVGKRYKRHPFQGILIIISLSSLLLSYMAYSPRKQLEANAAPVFHPQSEVKETQSKPGLPARLLIPAIKVDARINHVGLTENGDMDAPTNIAETGWYKHGPLAGENGSAVIDGHHTGLNGEPGIFRDLSKLQKGDLISVIDDEGQTISFIVRDIRSYDQNEQADEVFNSTDGNHLNLITCGGGWDKANQSFTHRLVVFSDRISSQD